MLTNFYWPETGLCGNCIQGNNDLLIVLVYSLRESIQKFRETSNLKHIDKNKLDEACFAYNAAYSGRK